MNIREIECLHDQGLAYDDEVVPWYRPILREELAELMAMATSDRHNNRLTSNVQERLCMAIPGMTCPIPTEGPVADKENLVITLFMKELKTGPTLRFMSDFFQIINGDRNSHSK